MLVMVVMKLEGIVLEKNFLRRVGGSGGGGVSGSGLPNRILMPKRFGFGEFGVDIVRVTE